MTVSTYCEGLDMKATEYHCIHPQHADLDLRIFKSLCEGNPINLIASEQACSNSSVGASLNRISDYMVSSNLFSIVEIFRYLLYNASVALPAPATMGSVLDTLYHAASEGGMVKLEDTKVQFSQLHELSTQMPPQLAEDVTNTVLEIFDVVERISFAEGVKVGFQLGKELTA